MTALAVCAKERGIHVSGSDTLEEFPTDETLRKNHIQTFTNFDTHHLKESNPDLVIYTGAHGGRENPEVLEAKHRGIPVLPHGQALGLFMTGKRQISVAGSHGKTTTAAMIAAILRSAGYDPSYAVGCGEITGLGAAGHWGKSDFFIAEADEYVTDPGHDKTPRFLWQRPDILAVTNIDFDHPDAYTSLDEVKKAFVKLRDTMGSRSEIIISSDDHNSDILAETKISVSRVGLSPRSDFQISDIHFGDERTFFHLTMRGISVGEFGLRVPGIHNAVNAGIAAVVSHMTGISWQHIAQGLLTYNGTKRRFEKIGTIHDITFIDDYAHHPKEIAATLAAARAWYPNERIIAVFQPHTYTRTKALLTGFARAFKDADVAVLTDIYASAREKDTLGISGQTLAAETIKYHSNVVYLNTMPKVAQFLHKTIEPHDVVIFMGAGDIYRWGRDIVRNYADSAS